MARAALFGSQDALSAFAHNMQEMRKEIWNKDFTYVLNVDVSEWLNYFRGKYEYIPITLRLNQVSQTYKNKTTIQNLQNDQNISSFFYHFEINVPFTGSTFLFFLKPSNCRLDHPEVEIPNGESGILIRQITLQQDEPNQIDVKKTQFIETLITNTENINSDVELYNSNIPHYFEDAYNQIRQKALKEQQFFASLNIEINTQTDKLFKVPIAEKRKIPEPLTDKKQPNPPSKNSPTVDDKFYHDVIDTIYLFFKALEKKPVVYNKFDEEGLRDYVLPTLEIRYITSSVTGETFNKGGKTDILIKHTDGSNLFVAECKFWGGEALLFATIDQLFQRYLTWRDSKTAIILFVRNKEFSKVLSTIKDAVPQHPYFVRNAGTRGDSSFSYLFHFPEDEGKIVYVEIMAFHFP